MEILYQSTVVERVGYLNVQCGRFRGIYKQTLNIVCTIIFSLAYSPVTSLKIVVFSLA